jgi:hypothetical protein
MNEIKIPFGRSITGTMIAIEDAARGLECNCFCVSCDGSLVACKGEKVRDYFRHHVDPQHCVAARETALHKFAKQVICETRVLQLPDDADLGAMRDAKMECWLDGIRPDVFAEFDEPVAIEIRVAHSVPSDKIKKYVARNLAALEIDLSYYRAEDRRQDEWCSIIQRTAHRFWLWPPAVVRAKMERAAREAEQEAQRRREAHEYREYRERLDREFYKSIALEALRREAAKAKRLEEQQRAEQEYQQYRNQLAERAHDDAHASMIRGLQECSDTERHLADWERRNFRLCEAATKRPSEEVA